MKKEHKDILYKYDKALNEMGDIQAAMGYLIAVEGYDLWKIEEALCERIKEGDKNES